VREEQTLHVFEKRMVTEYLVLRRMINVGNLGYYVRSYFPCVGFQ
jgi:hypothetical protein